MSGTTQRAGGASGYEQRDAQPGTLVIWGVVLIVVTVAAMVFARWMFDELAAPNEARDALHPMAAERKRPAGPVLQANPAAEMDQHRAWEEETLSTYGWIDPVDGVVRVPVERAVEMVLDEGLPVAEGAVPLDSAGSNESEAPEEDQR